MYSPLVRWKCPYCGNTLPVSDVIQGVTVIVCPVCKRSVRL